MENPGTQEPGAQGEAPPVWITVDPHVVSAMKGSPELERAAQELAEGRAVRLEPARLDAVDGSKSGVSAATLRVLTSVATILAGGTALGLASLAVLPTSLVAALVSAGVGAAMTAAAVRSEERAHDPPP